jgi:hypothetical protein
MKFSFFFWRKKKTEAEMLEAAVKRGGIEAAFKARAKEIESLRRTTEEKSKLL